MTASPLTAAQIRSQFHARLPHLAGRLQPEVRLDELQLDSLDMMELLMQIDELFGVRLSAADLQQVGTVGELEALVAARHAGRPVAQS